MKKKIIGLIIIAILLEGLTFLPSCTTDVPPKVLYEGILTNVSTNAKTGITTITFFNNTAVTSNYTPNFSDGVLIFGETYNLIQQVNGGETQVYLAKAQ